MQNLATTVAFDQVASEYSTVIQAAGLPATIINPATCSTPGEFRRMLTRTLQDTLPSTVPRSVRADASYAPDAVFAQTEAKVREAVFEQAHQSPELRMVVERDRSGREEIRFYGQKRSWMAAYTKEPLLMRSIGGTPVRLPTIL